MCARRSCLKYLRRKPLRRRPRHLRWIYIHLLTASRRHGRLRLCRRGDLERRRAEVVVIVVGGDSAAHSIRAWHSTHPRYGAQRARCRLLLMHHLCLSTAHRWHRLEGHLLSHLLLSIHPLLTIHLLVKPRHMYGSRIWRSKRGRRGCRSSDWHLPERHGLLGNGRLQWMRLGHTHRWPTPGSSPHRKTPWGWMCPSNGPTAARPQATVWGRLRPWTSPHAVDTISTVSTISTGSNISAAHTWGPTSSATRGRPSRHKPSGRPLDRRRACRHWMADSRGARLPLTLLARTHDFWLYHMPMQTRFQL